MGKKTQKIKGIPLLPPPPPPPPQKKRRKVKTE